jgi:Zn-dependent peptidase ImmA (M78 family)
VARIDTNRGAKRARETREFAGLAVDAPINCLLTFVEDTIGVPVVLVALPERISGCCARNGERTLLWVNAGHTHTRQRFTLAHELGHLRCGHDDTPVETFTTLGGKSTDSREVQANAFAAELLAPKMAVAAWAAGREVGLDDVLELAARFGISAIAALYRLNQLGFAPPGYDELRETVLAEDCPLPAPYADGIAAAVPPRLSPALNDSALAAILNGTASTKSVAQAMGWDPDDLAGDAGTIGI